MTGPLRGTRLGGAAAGGAVVAAVVGLAAWAGLGLGLADGPRADALDGFFPRGHVDPRVVVVGVDRRFARRAALDPVSAYTSLITRLVESHARSVVPTLDVLETARSQYLGLSTLTASFEDALAASLGEAGNVVLPLPEGRLSKPPPGSRIPGLDRAVPSPVLAEAAAATGIGDAVSGSGESVTRTVPLIVELRAPGSAAGAGRRARREPGSLVPSVALIALMRADSLRPTVAERDDGIEVGGRFVPTEGDQELRVDYAAGLTGRGRHVISASDLVDGFVPPESLRNKTMFVGITDPASAKLLPAPVGESGRLPSVLVEANAANTLLTRQYLTPPSDTTTMLWVVGLAFIVAFLVLLVPMWLTPLVPIAVGAGYWLYAQQRFDAGHVADVVYPLAVTLLAFVAAGGWKGTREILQRRRVAGLFASYVPHTVARQLLEGGRAEAAAAGQRLEVSLFFCDVRGFTALSATLTPAQVREMLDAFYELLTEVILAFNGTVVKFVGDEVFAVFGAPLPIENHAQVAVDCACEIQRRSPELRDKLVELGIPEVQFGIGTNTGEVVAAHVGGGRRRQYDVVGDTVNLASRLCGQAGRGEIVAPAAMLGELSEPPPTDPMGAVQLKGIPQPVSLVRIHVEVVTSAV